MNKDLEPMKIRHITVTEQVSQKIQEMISSGQFKPGDKLPTQKELEEMMGVSRPTLREAISRLISLDIIQARQGQGYFVKEPETNVAVSVPKIKDDDHKVRDLFEARLFLEATLSQLASVFADDDEVQDLVDTCERIENGDVKAEDCTYGENHIHALIAKYSHNKLLAEFEYSMLAHLAEYPNLFVSSQKDTLHEKYEAQPHRLIVDAIRRRDPTAAYNEALRHILLYVDDIGVRIKYDFSLLREKE